MEQARPDGSSVRFLFSGDLGHYDQPIVKDPAQPPECDYLMCESTYGDRLHGRSPVLTVELASYSRWASELQQAAATRNLLRAFAQGGYANLASVHQWMLGFVKDSPQARRYQELAGRISEDIQASTPT